MSCPWRRCEGSGFQKPVDPALSAANEKALADLMAARARQDAVWTSQTAPVTDISGGGEERPSPKND